MSFRNILFECGAGVARLTLNRPERLNSLNIEMHEEVRAALADVMERGLAPRVDLDYLATACIAIVREVGERMLERKPLDVAGATEFCVTLILGGLAAAPRAELLDGDRVHRGPRTDQRRASRGRRGRTERPGAVLVVAAECCAGDGAHDAGPSMGRPHGQLLPTHP